MTDFEDSARAMRARLAEFDTARASRQRPRHEARLPARALRGQQTPRAERDAARAAHVRELHARPDDHPMGSISKPLAMGPHKSPNTRARG